MTKCVKKIFFLFFLLAVVVIASKPFFARATESLQVGDWVYYDPINDVPCSQDSYWTPYNTAETCYRWAVVLVNDNGTVRLLLDHNTHEDVTYSERVSKIDELKNTWYSNNISMPGIVLMSNVMFLDWSGAITDAKQKISAGTYSVTTTSSPFYQSVFMDYKFNNSPLFVSFLFPNLFQYKGNIEETNGYWVGASSDSSSAAASGYTYCMTNSLHLAMCRYKDSEDKDLKLGIRPTITVPKTKVKQYEVVDLLDNSNKNEFQTVFHSLDKTGFKNFLNTYYVDDGAMYLAQGLSVRNNNVCLYMGHRTDSDQPGYIYCSNSDSLVSKNYGHGNDITYNTNENKYAISTGNKQYLQGSSITSMNESLTFSFPKSLSSQSIAYDKDHDSYYVGNSMLSYMGKSIDEDYTLAISTAVAQGGVGQNTEYHDGYLYKTYWDSGGIDGSNKAAQGYQLQNDCRKTLLYCTSGSMTNGFIYVYNAKLNKNNQPSKGYGKLVTVLRADYGQIDSNNTTTGNITAAEIEAVSFDSGVNNDVMYVSVTNYSSSAQGYTHKNFPSVYQFDLSNLKNGSGKYYYATNVHYYDDNTVPDQEKYYSGDILDLNYYNIGENDNYFGWLYSRSSGSIEYHDKNDILTTPLFDRKNDTITLETVKMSSDAYPDIYQKAGLVVFDEKIEDFIGKLILARCRAVVLENGIEKTSGVFQVGKTYQLKIKAMDDSSTIIFSKDLYIPNVESNCRKMDYGTVLFIGDSYARGYNAFNNYAGPLSWSENHCSWVYQTSGILNLIPAVQYAGGTGFVREVNNQTFTSLMLGASNAANSGKITWLIVQGGYNDSLNDSLNGSPYSVDEISSKANEFVSKAKAKYQNAQIAIGMIGWSLDSTAQQNIRSHSEVAYKRAASESNVLYITNSENILRNNTSVFSDDGFHPLYYGQFLLSEHTSNFLCTNTMNIIYHDGSTTNKEIYITGKNGVIQDNNNAKFLGWSTSENGTVQYHPNDVVSDSMITHNTILNLYAVYQKEIYTVTFESNGGMGTMDTQIFNYGESKNLIPNTYTREGYSFYSWNTKINGNGSYLLDEASVGPLNKDYTLYAMWTPISYHIAFDANGGTGTMDSQRFVYGTAQKLKENTFTKDGYYLTGWNTERDGSGQAYTKEEEVSNLSTISGTIVTLYAQWAEVEDYVIEHYSVDETNHYIDLIEPSTIVNTLLSHITLHGGYRATVSGDSSGLVSTGSVTNIYNGDELVVSFTNIVRGDVNGDGKISALDYVKIKNHIMGTHLITGYVYRSAADANHDNAISALDYVRIKNIIMNGTNHV